jgi:hypothetical protein
MTDQVHHSLLWKACRKLPEDYQPYGDADRGDTERIAPDCSTGCVHFYLLEDKDGEPLGLDWGVCTNPKSHRCGLLTFEHQGCPKFEG